MSFSDHLKLKVYKIDQGNLDTFVRFEKGNQNIESIDSLLQAYRKLWEYLENIEETSLLEIWQAPIPFSRTLGYATLFRLNPHDSAYLVSPVEMKWLEPPGKTVGGLDKV